MGFPVLPLLPTSLWRLASGELVQAAAGQGRQHCSVCRGQCVAASLVVLGAV